MFNRIQDTIDDDIGQMLHELLNMETYTKNKKELHHKLIGTLENRGYYKFLGHPSNYYLSRIGDSYLYDVPINRRGHLKIFRGKRVRLICVSSGRYERCLMVNTVE